MRMQLNFLVKRTKVHLPEVSYASSGIKGFISPKTMEYHYGKHHATYVDTLNKMLPDHESKMKSKGFDPDNLDHIIFYAHQNILTPIFNNSAQVYNHNFYWSCLAPEGASTASEQDVAQAVPSLTQFENLGALQDAFSASCVGNFGSGWTWLMQNKKSKKVEIVNTKNAETVIDFNVRMGADGSHGWEEYEKTAAYRPVLVCDVWEHAYYIDYFNKRADYAKLFWQFVNWDRVSMSLKK